MSIDFLLISMHTDLSRMRRGRKEEKSPKMIEFEHAQSLKPDGIKAEWQSLRESMRQVSSISSELVLGIMAESGSKGIDVLARWVTSLQLCRGILIAYDDYNEVVEIESLKDIPVYIKYNSSDSGNAYMKPFNGNFTGVIFQPKISSRDEFYQFGNIPLAVFK